MKRTGTLWALAAMLVSLVLILVLSVFPAVTAVQNQIGYTYDEQTDTLTFTGKGIVSQETIWASLEGKNSVDTVILSDGVSGICDPGYVMIRKIVLGKDVKSCEAYVTDTYELSDGNRALCVYDDALYSRDCKTLLRVPAGKEKLSFPDGLQTIGAYAFAHNQADLIILPWGVTTILEGGLCSKGYLKIIPDTVTRFDTPSTYRYPSGVYLWEAENRAIENAAEVYAANDTKALADALMSLWERFGTISISSLCKGEKNPPDAGWYSLAGKSLYFGTDGKFLTGWQQIDGNRYSFMDCGIMRTGVWTLEESYTDKLSSGLTYCFDENGALMTDTNYTDPYSGKSCLVDEMGVILSE